MTIPEKQRAVQLTGPNTLELNDQKEVFRPNAYQILCKVKVVGLCFSDLKLLKQFDRHPRKRPVLSGADPDVLTDIPSYVPDTAPTVPGHEPVVEVVETGENVQSVRPGERYFIQADWRWLDTGQSKGALGYNFEGALQEYILLDERVIISPDGESVLLSADDPERSIAAYGLIEPWACVEFAYRVRERTAPKQGGAAAVIIEAETDIAAAARWLAENGVPATLYVTAPHADAFSGVCGDIRSVERPDDIPETACDDVLYFGSNAASAEALFGGLAGGGLLWLMLCGGRFERDVVTPLGDVHYRGLRIAGTAGAEAQAAAASIPADGEIRAGDRIHVVGAGGPMGVMHVVRNICQGVSGIAVYASDLSDERLDNLRSIAGASSDEFGVPLHTFNPKTQTPDADFSYIAVMAPVPALVAAAARDAARGGIINIFAGIAAGVTGEMDLNAYAEKGLYMIGTSGSDISDMRAVLEKVQSGRLDTNVSVAAVAGLEGAVDGIRAVERQEIPGKILVYPECRGLPLTLLTDLPEALPDVADKLHGGLWTKEAEDALLAACRKP